MKTAIRWIISTNRKSRRPHSLRSNHIYLFVSRDSLVKVLSKPPKGQGDKMDECQIEALHRAVAKRRVSHHTSTEHDIEVCHYVFI